MNKLYLTASLLLSIVSAVPQTKYYNWEVTNFTASYDGVTRYVLGINNKPGHLTEININLGDTIIVTVKNSLNVPTSLHWHGMRQYGTQEMDGPVGATQCGIKPGKTIVYKFTPSHAGTYWWHAHYGAQYIDGLRGPLIIKNEKETYGKEYDEEITIQLTDWYHAQSETLSSDFLNNVLNPDGNEPVWETSLMNGRGTFSCQKTKMKCNNTQPITNFKFVHGRRYRLRLINMAAFAAFDFSIDKHLMRVIEVDGEDTVMSGYVNTIRLNVAQRYSVIVVADLSGGNYWVRAKSVFGNPWTSLPKAQFPPGFNPNAIGVITYSNTAQGNPQNSPWVKVIELDDMTLKPYNSQYIKLVADQVFLVKFGIFSTNTDPVTKAYVSINNGSYNSYKVPTIPSLFAIAGGTSAKSLPVNSNVMSISSGKLIEIKVVNSDPGEHPFHLHGRSFWVVGKGTTALPTDKTPVNTNNPLRRDTFTVPPCNVDATGGCVDVGYTTIRFMADNPGVWLFHCHIEWHIQSGLSMTIVESADILQKKGLSGFSKDLLGTCN